MRISFLDYKSVQLICKMDTRVALGSSSLPMVGFGTYQIEDDLCVSVVEDALKAGYRHIDTAEFYGKFKGSYCVGYY